MDLSFSSNTKSEICKNFQLQNCCAEAEFYGCILYCNTFSKDIIKIVTENRPFAKRLIKLLKKTFGFEFDIFPEDMDKKGKLILAITDKKKLDRIFETYGYERGAVLAHHINFGVIENECCSRSFARGAFLAGGSVTDPEKRYHLELVTAHYNVSREMTALLMDIGFEPKNTSRNGNYITYFKNSTAIEDFLTTIGAPVAAMEIMSAKITKGMNNTINRKLNCDEANISKTVEAAAEQIEAIMRINSIKGIDNLPDKLSETAKLRLENPELSISQLAEMMNPPVTKSCLSHRLRKIMKIADELK